jgi:hypothetical protein
VLPTKMVSAAAARGIPIVAIEAMRTGMGEMATASRAGLALTGAPTALVPPVCDAIAARLAH